MIHIIDHKAVPVPAEAPFQIEAPLLIGMPIESTSVWMECAIKASTYSTEPKRVVLRPLFENNKIGNPIPLSGDIEGELLKASKDYNYLEGIAWNANNVIFRHFLRGSQINDDTIETHLVQLEEALNGGKQIMDDNANVFKRINEKVEFYEGKLPTRILVFSNDKISGRYHELRYLIEDNWESSKIKQRLSNAKKTLISLKTANSAAQLKR